MNESRILPVPDTLVGERIDAALSRMLGMSRTRCQTPIEVGNVLVGGGIPLKSTRLATVDSPEVTIPAPQTPPVPIAGANIPYDDEDIVVVDKPVGVAVHTGPGWSGPTVLGNLEAAKYRTTDYGPPECRGIIHRLDVDTSGAITVTKFELTYSVMKHTFKGRTVTKIYHAVIASHMDPPLGTIEAPIEHRPSREWRMAVIEGDKAVITHYDILELMVGVSLLKIRLETGHTHQIRVRTATLGHPYVGDVFYEADPKIAERLGLERQWLYAVSLSFAHPRTGVSMSVRSPYPPNLTRTLELLRNSA